MALEKPDQFRLFSLSMYKFLPIVKTLVWGEETWIMSSVPGNESVVSEGPEKGKTINEVLCCTFPLLIKFIDSRDDLSIQVHPDDKLAKQRHNCNGKTEMWYVRAADNGAHLISGFNKKLKKEEYVQLVEDNRIAEALRNYNVSKGDVFFLPAGRIHAIGGGCHILEIQQSSDITYRIYDYGRPGKDGKPRELHTELAKDAIDFSVQDNYRTEYSPCKNCNIELVRCKYFVTSLLDLDRGLSFELEENASNFAAICIEGSGRINGSSIKCGESVLFGREERTFSAEPDKAMKIITTFVPEQEQ